MASLESAFTGAVASSLAATTVYPLDLAKTLIQTQHKNADSGDSKEEEKYKNVIDCIIKIFKKRGFLGLYQGLATNVAANFVQNFIYFFWYSLIRSNYFVFKAGRLQLKDDSKFIELSTIEELALGMSAGAMTQVVTNPISVISTRQQLTKDGEDASLKAVIKQIYEERLQSCLVLSTNPAITYGSYQKLKSMILTAKGLSGSQKISTQLSAGENFLLGMFSKMISTFVTQPLIVAKITLQGKGSKFKTFQEVLQHIYQNEGFLSLWKGVIPQVSKGVIVQGLLFTYKDEIVRVIRKLLFLYKNIIARNKLMA
ncbi:related to Peroxisomal adenine nucleotide transporter 1 [Nakaseomyces glabratus]|nr:related to Peroxisomal adenine nucleotide transporter 1 [Nakaseomyces glabratus]SLM16571.1 related to Peroxisomal adenine nucleotide transporter 1 [Nakaseomyces glabratus]